MNTDTALEILIPGSRIELVVAMDLLAETIEVRSATVYEADIARVIVSQTDPPLSPQQAGSTFSVSFLNYQGPGLLPIRWAYEAELSAILTDYTGPDGQPAGPALVLSGPKSDFRRESLRLTHRVKGAQAEAVAVDFPSLARTVTLVDISMGGFLASFAPGLNPQPGDVLPCTLQFEANTSVPGLAEVKNVCLKDDSGTALVGFRFIPPDVTTARILHRRVFRMMALENSPVDY